MPKPPKTPNWFNLKGKTALITGASGGLGAHFATVLANAGAHVGLAARRREKLDALAATLDGRGTAITMDVTAPESIAQGIDAFVEAKGALPDILINNAGIADPSGFLAAENDATDDVFATNQKAVFSMAQALSQRWVDAARPGVIINIASIAGLRPVGGAASYAASKAAVIQLTKVQALELAQYNIRVNALAPGYFATDINQGFLNSPAGEALIKRVPMRRVGRYQDLDGPLLLLASDAGQFMTGAVIPVDGGHLCSSL